MKSKIAAEAIKGQKTVQGIAKYYEVHPNQVSLWKKQALEHLPDLFSDKRGRMEQSEEGVKAKLYQQIGQLQIELDWLKKIWIIPLRFESNGSKLIIHS